MNLPSTKKLIAVLSNPHIQMRALTVAICLLAAVPVFAQAGGDPWTRAVQVLQQSFTTTIARGLALVAIVVGGLGFAYVEGRLLAGIIFGSGMAVLASAPSTTLQSSTAFRFGESAMLSPLWAPK